MEAKTLNERQKLILSYLSENEDVDINELLEYINEELKEVSKVTLNRDLDELRKLDFIIQKGLARATRYLLTPKYQFLRSIDLEEYFQEEPDERSIKEKFDFNIFGQLSALFTQREVSFLNGLTNDYRNQVKFLSPTIKKKEFERLTIELSWKSSKIEGNTYSLLETEFLLREGREAEGKSKLEAQMLLNHKITLEYIRSNEKLFQTITPALIIKIHDLLTKDLGISHGYRKTLVGIGGTRYMPLDNSFQIQEAIEKTCSLINNAPNVFEKSLLALSLISYIQPFEDGNKRASRLTANAILLANNASPLSFRSIDELEYKKAVLVFYELNNISNLKRLFMEQYEFAVKSYFRKKSA